jgi:predicted alpha/beta superfamily hydrolase
MEARRGRRDADQTGKIEPVIIVGIYNSEQRAAEFTPKALSAAGSEGTGEVYGKFVVEGVKPFIDSMYRTNPDKQSTGIGGSSMGALIAVSIVKQYPDKFGKIALLTPHLWCNGKNIYAMAGEDLGFMKAAKVWLDMGSAGGDNYPGKDPLADAQQFAKKLESAGLVKDKDLKYTEYPGGEHKESAWQTRCDQVLLWLYGK